MPLSSLLPSLIETPLVVQSAVGGSRSQVASSVSYLVYVVCNVVGTWSSLCICYVYWDSDGQ